LLTPLGEQNIIDFCFLSRESKTLLVLALPTGKARFYDIYQV
jgi:hypothetical protein